MSDEDIKAGTNWSERIKKELADTTVGIVCMTPENQDAKWINYEMGALSKEVTDGGSRVIPLLIGFGGTSEVGQPAASLNMVLLGQKGFKRIATSLNDISPIERSQADLELVSDMWWEKLGPLMEAAAKEEPEVEPAPVSEASMVEEILESVRALRRSEELKQMELQAFRHGRPERTLSGDVVVSEDKGWMREITEEARRSQRREAALSMLRTNGFPDAAIWTSNGVWKVKTTGSVPLHLREQFNRMLSRQSYNPRDLVFEDISGQEEFELPEDK